MSCNENQEICLEEKLLDYINQLENLVLHQSLLAELSLHPFESTRVAVAAIDCHNISIGLLTEVYKIIPTDSYTKVSRKYAKDFLEYQNKASARYRDLLETYGHMGY